MKFVKSKVHLVLIVVPFDGEKDITANEYLNYIKTNNISCTFLQGYNRELPLALSQWRNTKAVVCPSRGEPFSNIPLEVGLWAKDQGPVVIASNIDGFTEQITNGVDGFLFQNDNPKDLSKKIEKVLNFNDKTLSKIRENAYNKVIHERDFYKNITLTFNHFWNENGTK